MSQEIARQYRCLVSGIRNYCRKHKFGEITLGLSGGIDSSLTAVLAVDALSCDNVVGVFMPSRYTGKRSRRDVVRLADNCGIRLITIPIDKILTSFRQNLPKELFRGLTLVEENLQARIRANILMAFSNKFDWLVLATGNKSEASVGYCTLYGDTAGGLMPLKGIYKTEVYRLARFRDKNKTIFPASVLRRPPSAELKPRQKDSDALPPYLVLDKILRLYLDKKKTPEEIAGRGFSKKTVASVVKMAERSQFKRQQSPPGVKINAR